MLSTNSVLTPFFRSLLELLVTIPRFHYCLKTRSVDAQPSHSVAIFRATRETAERKIALMLLAYLVLAEIEASLGPALLHLCELSFAFFH